MSCCTWYAQNICWTSISKVYAKARPTTTQQCLLVQTGFLENQTNTLMEMLGYILNMAVMYCDVN